MPKSGEVVPSNLLTGIEVPPEMLNESGTGEPPPQEPEEGVSLVKRARDFISKPVEDRGFWNTLLTEMTQAGRNITDYPESSIGRNIREALTKRGSPIWGSTAGALVDAPQVAGNLALSLFGGTIGAATTAAGHKANVWAQNIPLALGAPERVAGTVGTAANLLTQFLSPGASIKTAQKTAQGILPHLPGAQAAMSDKLTSDFATTLAKDFAGAAQKEAKAAQAFAKLEPSNRLPMTETGEIIKSLLVAEREAPTGARATLRLMQQIIKEGGGTLSPQQLNQQMTHIGKMTKVLQTQGFDPSPVFTRLFAALAKDASTPVLRVESVTPRISAPVLGLPAPGTVYPIAGGRFEAGPMSKTLQTAVRRDPLALPPPGEPPAAYGGRFEAGKVPMTRQVQSQAPERGEFIFNEAGELRPKVYIAPTSGEVPYSGVTVTREGVRPLSSASVLGRRQVVLTPEEGQLPFRDPITGQLKAKVLQEPWKPGEPVRKTSITETSVRPMPEPSVTGRRQRVLSPEEAREFRDPVTGELVAPGTRRQFADISGQTVLDHRTAIRERKSYEDIGKAMDKLIRAKQGFPVGDEFQNMSGARMLNWLKDRPKTVEGIPEAAMDDLEKILVKLAELPAIPPPKGVMYGSGKAVETAATIGGAVLLGGGSTRAAAMAGSLITGMSGAMRALLPTAIGRKAVLGILESGPINQTKINMLMALANTMIPGYLRQQEISKQIKETLKTESSPQDHAKQIQDIVNAGFAE